MVVRMRHTRSKTGQRRSHHALVAKALSVCPNCGEVKESHRVCLKCGQYRSRIVIDIVAAAKKKGEKAKTKDR